MYKLDVNILLNSFFLLDNSQRTRRGKPLISLPLPPPPQYIYIYVTNALQVNSFEQDRVRPNITNRVKIKTNTLLKQVQNLIEIT
jgi:hypothetical protein